MSLTPQSTIVNALLEAKYDTTLADFLTEARTEETSYNRIARDLHDLTGGTVSVTGETIRRWINDLEAVA
jgi:signal transduction histidine kinase